MTVMEAFVVYPWLLTGTCVVLGLLVGSFLNVVIYRLPLMMQRDWRQQCLEFLQIEESRAPTADPIADHKRFDLVKPDSHCPACKQPVKPWQNIPVLSYLFLRGRCANCKVRISPRYPIIEAVSGLLSGLVAWQFGAEWLTPMLLVLVWSLIALTMIDFDHQLLPDNITLPLLWLGLMVAATGIGPVSTTDAVIGAAAGYLSLWSVYWAFKLLTGREGMGYGDFKLLAALGAWLGWQQLLLIILLSSIVGAVVGIGLMVILRRGRNVPIPFGPYLAGAGMITLLYGDWIIDQYLHLLMGVA